MGYTLNLILSYSILPAFLVGLMSIPHLKGTYLPLLACLGLGVLNEIISSIVIHNGNSNALNVSIYYLLEALLLIFQFKSWGLFLRKKKLLYLLLTVVVTAWTAEKSIEHSFHAFLPIFRMMTCFMMIGLSLWHIFNMVVFNRQLMNREPSFLFCFGFCSYFLCVLLVELFITEGSPFTVYFKDLLFRTSCLFNVLANVIYLIAILWVRVKPSYTSA